MPVVLEVAHPLVAERLALLRAESTANAAFRQALDQLSQLLVYEATRTVHTEATTVRTPLADAPAVRISRPPLLVPVLRAGLGMLRSALELLPAASVGFVGLKRDETTLLPDSYVTAIPDDLGGGDVLVLDPMLATGGSLVHTLDLLRDANAGRLTVVCVLAAPEGLRRMDDAGYGEVTVVTASVDSHLNEVGYIVPGLGDAGDRQFGVF
ncbi:MAG: uracil phosphoribosyltransferase [Acidimicrobiales bacterium]